MTYADCIITDVPTANKQAYLDHAKLAGEIFKKHGALKLAEHWGDYGLLRCISSITICSHACLTSLPLLRRVDA
jgi:uncharacterized protein YbaA (DUF1428 family)